MPEALEGLSPRVKRSFRLFKCLHISDQLKSTPWYFITLSGLFDLQVVHEKIRNILNYLKAPIAFWVAVDKPRHVHLIVQTRLNEGQIAKIEELWKGGNDGHDYRIHVERAKFDKYDRLKKRAWRKDNIARCAAYLCDQGIIHQCEIDGRATKQLSSFQQAIFMDRIEEKKLIYA